MAGPLGAQFRARMQAIADRARTVAEECTGVRVHTYAVRTRTWSGAKPGQGTPTDVDVTIDCPTPKLSTPEPRKRSGRPGRSEVDEVLVEHVSQRFTRDQLGDGVTASNVEIFWLIDGEPYILVRLDEGYTHWSVLLRRRKNR